MHTRCLFKFLYEYFHLKASKFGKSKIDGELPGG